MTRKGLVILGSTGSIGHQTLDIVRTFPDQFKLMGLAAGSKLDVLRQQIDEFNPPMAFCANEPLESIISNQCTAISMEDMVSQPGVDVVMVGTTGVAGLIPTIRALENGLQVCLANKEVIIMAGELIMKLSKTLKGRLIPVDSEPSAIWQCLQGNPSPQRIIITASGGPFRTTASDDLPLVTPEQALKHPTWQMGRRITIDSSTLMNKGFEVIEAHWLFDLSWNQIEVVIHPQSLIHSMVELYDGTIIAQMGPPDMRIPIQYALFYPQRLENPTIPKLDTSTPLLMEFEPLDPSRYPCFALALEAGRNGGTFPAVLTASDEIAVKMFLEHRINFTDIPRVVEAVLENHLPSFGGNLDDILGADEWARSKAEEVARYL